jgi:hypothetical protein
MEIRPFKRLKIVDSFSSNRYNETGVGALTEQILLTPGSTFPALVSALSTPQDVTNYRQQVEAIFDVTGKSPCAAATATNGAMPPCAPATSRRADRWPPAH